MARGGFPLCYLTPSDNGGASGSATCPLLTAETHRRHYLTSSDSENALGYTTCPLVTADMYQDPIVTVEMQQDLLSIL